MKYNIERLYVNELDIKKSIQRKMIKIFKEAFNIIAFLIIITLKYIDEIVLLNLIQNLLIARCPVIFHTNSLYNL